MAKSPDKPFQSISDIQRMVEQANPATELARSLASINAPAKALQDLSKSLTANHDLMKSTASASDIARQLAQQPEVIARLNDGMPEIDLNLPDISTKIKASLPRQLGEMTIKPAPSPIAAKETNPDALPPPGLQLESIDDLGHMVRRSRELRKLSQQEFADLAGVGRRFVSELENGKPTLEFAKVLQVARAAGISLIARDRSR